MKIEAKLTKVLAEYDGPAILVCEDNLNCQYIAVLVERCDTDVFLAVGVKPESLKKIVFGDADVRSCFVNPPIEQYFTINFSGDEVFYLSPADNVSHDLFPLENSFIPGAASHSEKSENIERAISANSLLIELSFNPESSVRFPSIETRNLIEGLAKFEKAIRYSAYQAAKRELSRHLTLEESRTSVLAFDKGSFQVLLQAPGLGDSTGAAPLEPGLQQIDEIFNSADSISKLEPILQKGKGHFANAFLSLMDFVVEADAPISYSWISPLGKRTTSPVISMRKATDIKQYFAAKKDLRNEILEIEGEFDGAAIRSKKWTIRSTDDRIFSGKLPKDSEIQLAGTVIGKKRYRFRILEKFHSTPLGEKETKVYELLEQPIPLEAIQ